MRPVQDQTLSLKRNLSADSDQLIDARSSEACGHEQDCSQSGNDSGRLALMPELVLPTGARTHVRDARSARSWAKRELHRSGVVIVP